jgi:CubicO group peptidase (beta-lactamase class C family)
MDEFHAARGVQRAVAPRELKRAAPNAELDKLLNAFLDGHPNTGLLILKGDTILAERYQYERKPEHRFTSMSMAKTLVAMLVGIAISENRISSIDDRADKYVPRLKGHPYGETPIRHLLTMSSGVKFTEMNDGMGDMALMVRMTFLGEGPGGVDTVLPFKQRVSPAGKYFAYAAAETQVLGLVLRAATGKPLAEYLSEKIWQPMGAEADATWNLDAGGHEIAFCCINATLRDWGRVGLLLANDGALGGQQIIPAAWVRAATTPDAPHLRNTRGMSGYGYQTWLISPLVRRFALIGVRGQAVLVDPDTKTVVVHTAVHASAQGSLAREAQFAYFADVLKRLE